MNLKSVKFLLVGLLSLSMLGCNKDKPTPIPEPTAEEKAIAELTGSGSLTWIVGDAGSVSKNGSNVSDLYTDFELLLKSTPAQTYTTKNNNQLFDDSGSWSFAGSNFDKIMLTGASLLAGREISYTQTGDNLKLSFSVPTPTSGRIDATQALVGDYVFNLIKK